MNFSTASKLFLCLLYFRSFVGDRLLVCLSLSVFSFVLKKKNFCTLRRESIWCYAQWVLYTYMTFFVPRIVFIRRACLHRFILHETRTNFLLSNTSCQKSSCGQSDTNFYMFSVHVNKLNGPFLLFTFHDSNPSYIENFNFVIFFHCFEKSLNMGSLSNLWQHIRWFTMLYIKITIDYINTIDFAVKMCVQRSLEQLQQQQNLIWMPTETHEHKKRFGNRA